MTILRMPPDISLPITTPPWPWTMVQLVIVTFSQGARALDIPCFGAGLDSDAVVADVDVAVGDVHVAARVRVDAVGVGRIGRVEDGHLVNCDVMAAHRVDRPTGRMGQGDALRSRHSGTRRMRSAAAGDSASLMAPSRNLRHQLAPRPSTAPRPTIAMPSSPQPPINAAWVSCSTPSHRLGDDRIVGRVLAAQQRRAGLQMQRDAIPQKQRAGHVVARREN